MCYLENGFAGSSLDESTAAKQRGRHAVARIGRQMTAPESRTHQRAS
jgi:hypothetical protein